MSSPSGRRKREINTAYDRRRALMVNRLACIAVGGILIFQTVQALTMEGEVPVWFVPVMCVLVAADALVLLWNFRTGKKMDQEAEREAAEAAALAEASETASQDMPEVSSDTEESGNE